MIFNRKTVFFNIIKSYFKYFANKSRLFYKNRIVEISGRWNDIRICL